jgi:hypothetical protein
MTTKKRRRIGGTRTRKATIRGRFHGDPVSIQITVRLKRIPKGMRITKKLLTEMIRRKAETSRGHWDAMAQTVVGAKEGKTPPGIELEITRWKNPARKKGMLRTWRYPEGARGDQADAWGSLWQIIANARIVFL